MIRQGWVLCPLEDDCIALEDMGFEVKGRKTIYIAGVDCYAYYVIGDETAYQELKKLKGRYYWAMRDERGENVERRASERLRESKARRDSMQSTLF